MSVEIITYWSTLFGLAKAEADARVSGDPDKLAKAVRRHEEYRQLCLRADKIL